MNLRKKAGSPYRKLRNGVKELFFPYDFYEKRNNFIFIHVPKVAGTAIAWEISGREGSRRHLPWYVYKMANPVFFEKAFKFGFVRNPWDRAVSAYRYFCRGGNGGSDLPLSREIAQYSDFSDFVLNGLGEGFYRNHLLFIPQSEFVLNGEGALVVDFLGRYENLHEDCKELFDKIGINKRKIKKKNAGSSVVDYKELYNGNGDVEVIREIYKQDIKKFGYSF